MSARHGSITVGYNFVCMINDCLEGYFTDANPLGTGGFQEAKAEAEAEGWMVFSDASGCYCPKHANEIVRRLIAKSKEEEKE